MRCLQWLIQCKTWLSGMISLQLPFNTLREPASDPTWLILPPKLANGYAAWWGWMQFASKWFGHPQLADFHRLPCWRWHTVELCYNSQMALAAWNWSIFQNFSFPSSVLSNQFKLGFSLMQWWEKCKDHLNNKIILDLLHYHFATCPLMWPSGDFPKAYLWTLAEWLLDCTWTLAIHHPKSWPGW